MRRQKYQSGFGTIEILLIVLIIAALVVAGLVVYQRYHKRSNTNNSAATNSSQSTQKQTNTNNTTQPPQDVYTGWKTYTSATEKATFRYPSNWTLTQPKLPPVYATDDATGITSPSGTITITWNSAVGGYGNEHSASYPYNTVVDRMPIINASGLYVVSGITTLDGSTYHPWIAVQNANGISQSGVAGDAVTFRGKHAINASTNAPAIELFSTSSLDADQNTPALAQAQATAWFSSAEAQQAKLILLSFSDQN